MPLIAAAADLVESAFKDKLASIQPMQASVEQPAGSIAGDGSATASGQIFMELMEASWRRLQSSCRRNQKLAACRVAAKTIRLRRDKGALQVRRRSTVRCLWPYAERCAPYSLRPTACSWAQGQ